MTRCLRAASAIVVGLGMIAAAPAPVSLVSNRATYDVSLASALPGGVVAVRGRTVTEFRDTCDGWATTQRFLSDMTDAANNVSRSDFVITAWESKAGKLLTFDFTNMVDGQVIEHRKGTATRNDDGTVDVALTVPREAHLQLPAGTMFPTEQTVKVLQAAEAGRSEMNGSVFQGGDKTDLYVSTAAIGKPLPLAGALDDVPSGAADMLRGVQAWPVLMSYFSSSGDALTPEYEVSSRLYANGIVGTMSLIYARFTLSAKLTKIEPLSTPPC